MADTVSVTQADRDLYARLCPDLCSLIYGGDLDHFDEMQAIVAFRLASTQPAPAFPRKEVAAAILASGVASAHICDDPEEAGLADALAAADAIAALLQGKQP